MIYPSLTEIRASYPVGKWEPLWTRLVLRPLSFPGAWLAVRLGFSANQVTLLSVLIVLLAGALLGAGNKGLALVGAIIFNIYAWLDCVDGHVARVRQEASCYGGWMDAFGGYVAYSCVLLTGGLAATHFYETQVFFLTNLNFIFLGSLAAIANLLMRVEYQHFRCLQGQEAAEKIKSQKRIGANLGITGFLMPALLVSIMMGKLHWLILFYTMFYTCAWTAVTVRLVKLVQKLQDNFVANKAGAKNENTSHC
jgi:phosphatidylglycerophosphate synthase